VGGLRRSPRRGARADAAAETGSGYLLATARATRPGYDDRMIRTALLSVAGRAVGGQHEDRSVQAIREVLAAGAFVEVDFQVVPDEQALIRAKLRLLTEDDAVDLVLTTGGIGLAPRDRAPEATLEVVEREIPGIAEAMRAAAAHVDPRGVLGRGVAGVRRGTLVVNLPASPESARAALTAVAPVLAAASAAVRGRPTPGDPS
jgi:molybdenum cofactor synthesis domain-containing protein